MDLSVSRFGWFWVAVMAVASLTMGSATAQTTAFSYQGRLTESGAPANGNFDVQFRMFDAPSAGTQQGDTLTQNPVAASNGVFTVILDFGAAVVIGADRFLEIGVRPSGSGAAYTVLAPRHQITSSPYAIQTLNAQMLGGLPSSRYISTDASGNVGIGTATPTSKMEIVGSGGLTIRGSQPLMTFRHTLFGPGQPISYDSTIKSSFGDVEIITASNQSVVLKDGGAFGIGRTNPPTRLAIGPGPLWTANGWSGVLSMPNASALGWEANSAGQRFGIGQTHGGLYFFRTNSPFANQSTAANYSMRISDAGNIMQDSGNSGIVKAMAYVSGYYNYVVRCYNGINEATAGTCGFTYQRLGNGVYRINFGFKVDDRFLSITAQYGTGGGGFSSHNMGANFRFFNSTTVDVLTYDSNKGDDTFDGDFMIFVF